MRITRLLITLIYCILPVCVCAATLEEIKIDTPAEWDAGTYNDTQSIPSGLTLRREDTFDDYERYVDSGSTLPSSESYSESDTPFGSNYKRAMFFTKDFATTGTWTFLANRIDGRRVAKLQPRIIDIWIKSQHHCCTSATPHPETIPNPYCDTTNSEIWDSGQYVYQMRLHARGNYPGRTWRDLTNLSLDVHYAPGHLTITTDKQTSTTNGIGLSVNKVPPNWDWYKWTIETDWDNVESMAGYLGTPLIPMHRPRTRHYIDDECISTYDATYDQRARGSVGAPDDTGWVSGNTFGFGEVYDTAWQGYNYDKGMGAAWLYEDPDSIGGYWIRLGQNIQYKPSYPRPQTMGLCTSLSRYKIYTGNYISNHAFASTISNINYIAINWNDTYENDTNTTALYGMSLALDPDKITSDSDFYGGTYGAEKAIDDLPYTDSLGHRSDQYLPDYTSGWISADSSGPHWIKYDCETPKKITYMQLSAAFTNSSRQPFFGWTSMVSQVFGGPPTYVSHFSLIKEYKLQGSNDDSTWTTVYPGDDSWATLGANPFYPTSSIYGADSNGSTNFQNVEGMYYQPGLNDEGLLKHHDVVKFTNNTGYRYYRLLINSNWTGDNLALGRPNNYGANNCAGLINWELREAASEVSAANSTTVDCEYRISTDAGSSWGGWLGATKGQAISLGGSVSKENLRVQTRFNLNTLNQKYSPLVTSVIVRAYDSDGQPAGETWDLWNGVPDGASSPGIRNASLRNGGVR